MARIIAVIIFGGFGMVLLYVGVTQFFRQRRLLANAQRVDAVIVHSEVFTSTSRDSDPSPARNTSTTTHRPDVKFRYTVAGKAYESDLLYPNIIVRTFASRQAAADVLVPYPLDAKVRAYVDPSLPDQAYLIPEPGAGPVVFIVVGLLAPALAWWVGKYI
jgi:hypothetical protein